MEVRYASAYCFTGMRAILAADAFLFRRPCVNNAGCSTNATCNADLRNLTSLQILDRVIDEAALRGLYVLLDMHNLVPGVQASGLWCVFRLPSNLSLMYSCHTAKAHLL